MVRFRHRFYLLALGFPLLAPVALAAEAVDATPASAPAEFVLRGGTLVDGTGAPGRKGDLAIRGDRIVAVGTFPDRARRPGRRRFLTRRRAGIHRPAHPLGRGDPEARIKAQPQLPDAGRDHGRHGQLRVGADRRRELPGRRSTPTGPGPTSSTWFPHGSLRHAVMGIADRPPRPRRAGAHESPRWRRGMKAGGWGMATGLDLRARPLAGTDELIELAQGRGRFGRPLRLPHPQRGRRPARGDRRGDRHRQVVRAARPHLAPEGQRQGELGQGGRGDRADRCRPESRPGGDGRPVSLRRLEHASSAPMVVPPWAMQAMREEFARLAAVRPRRPAPRGDPARARPARGRGRDPDRPVSAAMPGRVGRDLAAIARDEGTTPLDVVLDIQRARRRAGDQLRDERARRPR